ncbi:MAG: hypothetical protein LBP76_05450 [Treponema sp.]|jgi:hypothetical protein|nr:hypothetical protein [Treponema sp.]
MSAKLMFRGQCVVISLLFLACPLYLPEKVQIKTEPAIYLPLGTPDSLQENMNFSLAGLADSKPALSPDNKEIALYDFQGEYGDTRAFIIRMKLMEKNLGTVLDNPSPAPPGITPPDIKIDFEKAGISPIDGTKKGFELKDIQKILGEYEGLKFRSVPVYLYIQGPDRIFKNGNVTASITALDGTDNSAPLPDAELLSNQPVSPHAFPVFPDSDDEPMLGTLSPKPETRFDLKDILNQDSPPAGLDFKYKINIGNITIKYDELPAIREDFKTPLSAILVLVLPYQFTAGQDIPILAEKNTDPDAKAIHLLDEGKDLFGRNSADDESESTTKDMLERMQSLVIQVNVENNLGLAGYAPVYGARPDTDRAKKPLGRMPLSGPSSIAIPKSEVGYPFNIWVEIYLEEGQDFDIKRPGKDSAVPPLKFSLGIVVKTRINEIL